MQSVEYDVFRTALAIPGILITQSKIQTLKKIFHPVDQYDQKYYDGEDDFV